MLSMTALESQRAGRSQQVASLEQLLPGKQQLAASFSMHHSQGRGGAVGHAQVLRPRRPRQSASHDT
jgi:hypothetical protein